MVICAAFGCSSRSGRDKVSFFSFPKDRKLRNIWASKIGRGCINSKVKTYVPNVNSRLCSLHFDEECFVVSECFLMNIGFTESFKRKLKEDAVPTIFRQRKDQEDTKRRQRQSSDSVLNKKRKLQIQNTVTHTDGTHSQPIGENDINHTLKATPVNTDDLFPSRSGLEILAHVACHTECLGDVRDRGFHIQCQTPNWKNPSKEVQVGASELVNSSTQTDWENDTGLKYNIKLPKLNKSTEDSFFDELVDSRVDETSTSDITWEPSYDSSDLELSRESEESQSNQSLERKFIVFESNLDRLLSKCSKCFSSVSIFKKIKGSLLTCTKECHTCNETETWTSQPCYGSMAVGHLELSAAIMFSGCGTRKFLRALKFAGIAAFSESTFFNIQSSYLTPAVFHVWKKSQSALIEEAKLRGTPLILGGDGRCCSPGHTAKYGTYSVMDLKSGKILDIQLVQRNEVKNSHAMELEGLQRSLAFLITDCGLEISHLVTDRHSAVKKFMREQQPDITHWFDVWHVAKGIYKKLEAAGKKKGCEKVKAWARSVSNHLYWAAASSNGDGELVREKWLSILNHVADIHEGHGDKFKRCEHDHLDDRLWMKKGYKPHAELSKVVENKVLLKDIQKLSPAQQTSDLEAFHKVLCGWVPKSTHFMHSSMESRSKVSALHFNENARRGISRTKDGLEQYSVSFPKGRKGEPVVKEVKTEQTFGYVTELMTYAKELREKNSSYRIAKDVRSNEEGPRPVPLAQSTPKRQCVNKSELINAHISRFNSNFQS